MDNYDKDFYFELKDRLIKKLPEPEKSIYAYFRQVEKSNLREAGKLVINGKTPVQSTADHFMMEEEEIKKICRQASLKLAEWSK